MKPRPTEPDARTVFEILVRQNADRLMVFLLGFVRDRALAEDVFQDTMLVAWRRLADFDRSRPFGPWLRGIGVRIAMERTRTLGRMPVMDPAIVESMERMSTQCDVDEVAFREVMKGLADCLGLLPPDQRQLLSLVYQQDMPLKLVSEALDLAEETVKKRVQRLRGGLADCLNGKGVFA